MVASESIEFAFNTAGNDNDFFNNDYAESSAESVVSDGIDPLLGTRISTSAGPGVVDEIREYEDMQYCIVRLDTFGTVNMLSKSAQALLRKERKLSPPKVLRSGGNNAFQNVKGYIRMYNPAKGWGFICCEEFDGDIFLHSKHMVSHAPREYIGHFHSNQEGQQVSFDLDLQHKSRPQALNVRLLGEAEQASEWPSSALPKKKPTRPLGKGGASGGAVAAPGEEISGHLVDADNDVSSIGLYDADDAVQGSIQEGVRDPSSAAAAEGEEVETEGSTGLWIGTGPIPDRVAQKRGILRCRGLPFTATANDVAQFFDGFGVRAEDVTLLTKAGGLTNGEAHVQFAREELALRALKERNMSNMGHRYIELFPTKVGSETKEGTAAISSSAASDKVQHVAGQQGVFQELPPGPAPPAPTGIAAAAGPPPAPAQPSSTAPLPYVPGLVAGPTMGQPANPGLQNMQAVLAGAAAPTPAVAAAATCAAQHAAAAHSAQVVQAPGVSADVHEAAYAQNQQMVFQHYFQQYQQAYAAAAASQAVQAAAAAAAQQAAAQQFQSQPGQQPPLPPYDYTAASAAPSAAATATAPSDGASAAAVSGSTSMNQPLEAGASWPTPAAVGSADAAAAGVQSRGGWHSTPVASPPEANMVQGAWQGPSAAQPHTAGWWGTTENRLPAQQMGATPAAPPVLGPSMPPATPASVAPLPSEARPQYYNEI